MNTSVRLALVAVLSFVGVATLAPAGEKEKDAEVKLTPVKWKGYLAEVAGHPKAKLVIVDAWATWCGPCMKNFPHLVEMHEKYADKGLVAVSLSLDDADKPAKVTAATDFLKEKHASFTNLILDERAEDAFEKLNIGAIPAVFLYTPDGKELKRFTLDDVDKLFTYEQVEAYVKDYLDGKKPK
jgi:thiol-disulfide isomerase/thioredoxin